ncbi:monocarboxylate transporter 10-like [Diorhabda carinulata]|uniref:monocarboxylate transporter 10-like n=1 Tax=Diorhabda carinulata TaxID=1163345 RepID=UPI0025A2B542|nr:monocarboxylate transporter 10-like [Diorhabda carinulata]XP_057661393.1 monocarboxylate transporter 10-like [Diorhabda carinulata]
MNEQTKKKEEQVQPDGGYGWVIIFAIILLNASLSTLVSCFGIIFGADLKSMGVSAAQISLLLHLQSSLYCIVGFFGSPLLKKYQFRTIAFIGAAIWCSGIFITAFAATYTLLVFTISFITGIGQGILMPATYLATNTYFKKRLTLAVSISTTGATLFSVISPKICDILVTKVGRKYTVLILFFISLLSFIGCLLLKPLPKKEVQRDELVTLNNTKQTNVENSTNKIYKETTRPIKKDTITSKLISIFDLTLLKQPSYTVAIICLGVSFAAELNMVLMMQVVLPELSNFKSNEVANVTSVQFGFDIIGRLIIPMVCHYFKANPKWVYVSALLTATVARTLLTLYTQSYIIVYIACSIIGATKGMRAVYQSVIIPKLVPLDKFVAANGFQMFFTGAISLVIGPIIGVVHDAFSSYKPALHASSILSCFCVILWIFETCFTRKISVNNHVC